MFAIYSGLSCNFPQPRKADAFLGGIDRLFIIRASASIRFPVSKITADTKRCLSGVSWTKTDRPMLRAAEKVT
jgi:hypothetical protein